MLLSEFMTADANICIPSFRLASSYAVQEEPPSLLSYLYLIHLLSGFSPCLGILLRPVDMTSSVSDLPTVSSHTLE